MRILFLNNYFNNYGGADVYTYTAGKILRRNGHDVFFFSSDQKPFFEENYEYAKYFPRSIDYKSLPKLELVKHGFRPFYNFEAEQKLNEYIKDIKPDVVHANIVFFNLTPAVLNACYKNNIPVVMTLHGPQLMCPSVKMMFKSEEYCKDRLCVPGNPIHCIINRCLGKSFIKSAGITAEFIFRKIHGLYKRVALFICPTQALLELAAESGISRDKLALINYTIDDSYFENQPHYNDDGYFLYVGRISKEKGTHYLLEALKTLPRDIKMHIVGEGPEKENLENLAKEYNLENVNFLGSLQGEDLKHQYRNCIASVLPCNWFEVFGLTIAESFIFGKPVIGSNIGGIPEMIENGINGFTFEPGNTHQLAELIMRLYKNKELAKEMGKNGRVKVESFCDQQRHYSKLIQVYESQISGVKSSEKIAVKM